jgi:hypothetical protein
MLHARDSFNPASQEFTSCSPAPTAYFSISGREWHNTPRIRSPVLTSACIYTQQNHNVFVRYHLFCVKNKKNVVATKFTLSNGCSVPRLARPPKKREVPRTSGRLDNMEPRREHFTTTTWPSEQRVQ